MAYLQSLRTYRAVDEVVTAFANGKLNFVVIAGNPGIGKTKRLRNQLGNKALIIECNASPFGIYCELGRRPEIDFLALDDVDGLFSDKRGVTLVKSLGQTELEKVVSWNTKAADREGLPRHLNLHCRVLMLVNEVKGRGPNFDAVIDRAHCYEFLPTAEEVHGEVQKWLEADDAEAAECRIEKEVFDFIGRNLHLIPRASFRHYVKASERARARLEWESSLLSEWSADPKLAAVAEIVRLAVAGDSTLATATQRADQFRKWGHGTRSTYMEYQKKIFKIYGWTRLPKAG